MLPTIQVGDRILVDKMAYDVRVPLTHFSLAHLRDPSRGDIVTIQSSAAHELLVKRVIGLPGDSIAMRNNVLFINGVRVSYRQIGVDTVVSDATSRGEYFSEVINGSAHTIRLSPDAPSPRDSFGPLTVPPGKYLMLGDNRDNSADSRYFGFFSRDEIIGKAERVAYSLNPSRYYLPRFDRIGRSLDVPPAVSLCAAADRPLIAGPHPTTALGDPLGFTPHATGVHRSGTALQYSSKWSFRGFRLLRYLIHNGLILWRLPSFNNDATKRFSNTSATGVLFSNRICEALNTEL
ncbi:signal peptidase I [Burkholderia sp. H160]|nr:signal peptidase I [Burkholderia sp. H160]